MSKRTYDEMMEIVDEELTHEVIEEVIEEMGLDNYPDDEVERMHLENDLSNTLSDWIDSTVQSMSLQELRDVTKKLENEELTELRIRKPERKINND